MAAGEMAETLMHVPAETAQARLAGIGERYAKALGCPQQAFTDALKTAQSHLQEMSKDLGLDLRGDARARRLLPPEPAKTAKAGALGEAVAGVAPGAAPAVPAAPATGAAGAAGAAAPQAAGGPASIEAIAKTAMPSATGVDGGTKIPIADDAARTLALEQGIAMVTNTMAGDTFRLNEVLRTILDTMHKAIGFRCVMFALRDPKTGVITGRFGLGEPAAALCAQMRVDMNAHAAPDLFTVACRKGSDTMINDARAPLVMSRLPTWLQREAEARSFILLPMTMKGAPFALIYADRAEAGGVALGERELSLMRTLRNQAVMAFKTA
jgi:hypothetical protein